MYINCCNTKYEAIFNHGGFRMILLYLLKALVVVLIL